MWPPKRNGILLVFKSTSWKDIPSRGEYESSKSCSSLLEDRFGHHGMNAFCAVDDLSHLQVHGSAQQHQDIITPHVFCFDDEIDHLTGCDFGSLIQILMEAHGHVVRRRFRSGPSDAHSLVQYDLDF